MPSSTTNLVFAALRLVGLLVVLIGVAQIVQRSLATQRSEFWQQQEELAVAAMHMERAGELAAERSHELRNGLAGLAGITHLLGDDGEDHERLKHAVLAELSRLHRILDGDECEPPVDYLVVPVLDGLVTLRGTEVTLDVESGVRARGDPAVLAQVVTNLLANCDRHAPGAPVHVTARQDGSDAVVEVRDEGPGLPPHLGSAAVLGRGVRDESAGGSGLGLFISGELLAREGGSLRLYPATHPRGCVVTVRVPAAAPLTAPASR